MVVEQFFQTLLTFTGILSVLVLIVGIASGFSAYKQARNDKEEMTVDGNSFFITIVLPIVYLVSYVLVDKGVV